MFFAAVGSIPACFAQSRLLAGRIVDAESGSAIPYASLRVEGLSYGAVSNREGSFELNLPEELFQEGHVLRVSSLGYESLRYPLRPGTGATRLELVLKPQPYSIGTVYIFGSDLQAAELVSRAFEKVPDNYADEPYLLQTFYRHYCQDDGVYGRLIEAAVEVYDRKGYRRTYREAKRKMEVRVNQLRRSFDFTSMSGQRHVPIALYQTLEADILSYNHPLEKWAEKRPDLFRCVDTTYYDGQTVFVIEYRRAGRYACKLYISAEDFAFLRIEEESRGELKQENTDYQWRTAYTVDYQRIGGRYYMSRLLNEGARLTVMRDAQGQEQYRSRHAHHVEMMVNRVLTKGFTRFRGKEPEAAELMQIEYKPGFWADYNVLRATPLERRIVTDLEERMPLSQQFSAFGETDAATHDYMQGRAFDRLLAENRGRYVLVFFWRSDKLPRLRDLNLARKLFRKYNDLAIPLMVILVSLDSDEQAWQETLEKRGMNAGINLRLAGGCSAGLAQRYGVCEPPHYLIFDREGNMLHNERNPPDLSWFEDMLSGWDADQ